eukprot:scaffold49532_cov75-Phaeocystis_antarctica.AAC.1
MSSRLHYTYSKPVADVRSCYCYDSVKQAENANQHQRSEGGGIGKDGAAGGRVASAARIDSLGRIGGAAEGRVGRDGLRLRECQLRRRLGGEAHCAAGAENEQSRCHSATAEADASAGEGGSGRGRAALDAMLCVGATALRGGALDRKDGAVGAVARHVECGCDVYHLAFGLGLRRGLEPVLE